MAKKGQKYKNHSAEFKISVIMDMRKHHLGYAETMRKYFPERDSKNMCYTFLLKILLIFLLCRAIMMIVSRNNGELPLLRYQINDLVSYF